LLNGNGGTTDHCEGRKQAGHIFFGDLLSPFTGVDNVAQGYPLKGIDGDLMHIPLVVRQFLGGRLGVLRMGERI
jgi:hypothetical protein